MKITVLYAFCACVAMQDPPKPPEPKAQETFRYDPWEAWNSFDAGSFVEYKQDGPSGKATIRRSIDRKTEDVVTIKVTQFMKVGEKDSESTTHDQVKKPLEGAPPPADRPCITCKKLHPKNITQDTTKLKIADQELECTRLESTVMDCQGKKIGTLSRYYSKDVPGWLVKMESVVEDTRTSTICTSFTRK